MAMEAEAIREKRSRIIAEDPAGARPPANLARSIFCLLPPVFCLLPSMPE